MHEHESYEELVAAANPALETFKGTQERCLAALRDISRPFQLTIISGGKKTKGAFIPGKGLHGKEPFDKLMAVNNPALETFKGM